MRYSLLIITYSPFLAAGLAFYSIVMPSKLKTRGRAVWAMILLLAASRSLFFDGFGGSVFTPELPELVIWCWYLLSSSLYVLIALRVFWRTPHGRLTLMPLLAVAISAWGMWEGLRPPAVKEVDLVYENLPASLDGYRILQISDLHCSSTVRGWRTRAVVEAANAAKADAICLTGDYVDGLVSERAEDLSPIFSLSAPDGVWCVTGNHEYYLDGARWRKWYRDGGLRFLANDCVHPRSGLSIAGVNDPVALTRGPDVAPNVEHAFAGSSTNDFRILLSHRPKFFKENVRKCGVDLQLSGHTHGGLAPVLSWLVAQMNGGFVRGLYREGDSYLYVSPGTGLWAGFPLRFFNPSEITLFVLKSRL